MVHQDCSVVRNSAGSSVSDESGVVGDGDREQAVTEDADIVDQV